MYAPNLPEPWMIDQLERQRRIRESEAGESARIPLYPPPPPSPAPHRRDPSERSSTVIVIDLA